MPTAIEFRDVSLKMPDGRLLLDGIHLQIEEGTTTAVLGRSGSGKTTLLRLVNRRTGRFSFAARSASS
jgi:osmoprotectant transport system ATP-binding protein